MVQINGRKFTVADRSFFSICSTPINQYIISSAGLVFPLQQFDVMLLGGYSRIDGVAANSIYEVSEEQAASAIPQGASRVPSPAGDGGSRLFADVSDSTQVRALFEAAEARFGRVDVLINNAGWTTVVPALGERIALSK